MKSNGKPVRFLQNFVTLYASGKKAFEGIVKLRQGLTKKDANIGFQGALDLMGSAGMALFLIPEGAAAGAIISLGSTMIQSVREFKSQAKLPVYEKTNLMLDAGLSFGAILFFVPGGFVPGTFVVGGISAVRQILKRKEEARKFTPVLPPPPAGRI